MDFSWAVLLFLFPPSSLFSLFLVGNRTFIPLLLDLALFPEVHSIICPAQNLLEAPGLTMAFLVVVVGTCALFFHGILVYRDQWVTHMHHVLMGVYALFFHSIVVLVPTSVVLQGRGIGCLAFCVEVGCVRLIFDQLYCTVRVLWFAHSWWMC